MITPAGRGTFVKAGCTGNGNGAGVGTGAAAGVGEGDGITGGLEGVPGVVLRDSVTDRDGCSHAVSPRPSPLVTMAPMNVRRSTLRPFPRSGSRPAAYRTGPCVTASSCRGATWTSHAPRIGTCSLQRASAGVGDATTAVRPITHVDPRRRFRPTTTARTSGPVPWWRGRYPQDRRPALFRRTCARNREPRPTGCR